ncbi:MAG: ComEC/Rec2 family competence protein [Bacteroidales bacterium]|nr:ComEC/Rec2 family competence protein [Bacteroidales bacterium]
MKEEVDIVYLSLPFTAAVAVGTMLSPSYGAALVAGTAIFLALAYFVVRKPRSAAAYALLMFACGLFCSLTGGLSALSDAASASDWQVAVRARLTAAVEALPFSSDGTAALVKALALGDRSSLSPEVSAAFRASGASHILALSGLHLGIFYMLLSYIMAPLGRSPVVRRAKSLTIILLSAGYVVIAGASASLVRALLFIILREGASMMYRKISLLRILLCAMMIQLMLSPGEIASASFQLSYLAVFGIALVYPWLSALYPDDGGRFNPVRKVWLLASLSISCQLFTAPVAWLRFRSFPKYFLLANLLAIPPATILTASAIGIVVLAPTGWCPGSLITIADFSASLLTSVLQVISGM